MSKNIRIGNCTYCGRKNEQVTDVTITRNRGTSTVSICNHKLCKIAHSLNPLGVDLYTPSLERETNGTKQQD